MERKGNVTRNIRVKRDGIKKACCEKEMQEEERCDDREKASEQDAYKEWNEERDDTRSVKYREIDVKRGIKVKTFRKKS